MVFCNGLSCLCDCKVDLIITQLVYSIVKHLKNGVLQWNIFLVWLLGRLNNHTSHIFHCKTLKNGVLQWIICLCDFKVDLTITQLVYSIVKSLKNGVLQWNIILVRLLGRLSNHTTRIFHCKTLKKWCFAMDYRACAIVKST